MPLTAGQRVHLKLSMEPVNGTVISCDPSGFTVRWDAAPDRRRGAPRGRKYRYSAGQAAAIGLGNRLGD